MQISLFCNYIDIILLNGTVWRVLLRRQDKKENTKNRNYEKQKKIQKDKIRHFYMNLKEMRKGYQNGVTYCRNKEANWIGELNEALERWKQCFNDLLNGEGGKKCRKLWIWKWMEGSKMYRSPIWKRQKKLFSLPCLHPPMVLYVMKCHGCL